MLSVAQRVRRAEPILENIQNAASSLSLGALERRASAASSRERLNDLKVMATVGPLLLNQLARDLGALPALLDGRAAPPVPPPARNVIPFDHARRRKAGA